MNLEKLEKLASLAEKYDYKPDESHFNNLAAFVGVNASLIADLCKEYTTLQREITNAHESLKSAGIEADTVRAEVMELVDKLRIKQNHIKLRDTYIEELEQRAEDAEAKLAELEKQEPVAWLILNSNEGYVERNPDVVAFLEGAGLTKCKPLFTRPAPAIELAGLVPDKWYFQLTFGIPNLDGMTPYQAHGAAWEQCRATILRNIEVSGNAGKDK